ncbi:hypothetical protein ACLOJK_018312 [Asimina triloba]
MKKAALRDVQNEKHNIIPKLPGNQPLQKVLEPLTDAAKLCGNKRLISDSLSNFTSDQSPCNSGTNGQLVYVRRKTEQEVGKPNSANLENTGFQRLEKMASDRLESHGQISHMQEHKISRTPAFTTMPGTSLAAFPSGGSSFPRCFGKPVNGVTVAEPMLRSLSPAGRNQQAVELEKRAINLFLEEAGKEMQRVKALNPLGKSTPISYVSSPTQARVLQSVPILWLLLRNMCFGFCDAWDSAVCVARREKYYSPIQMELTDECRLKLSITVTRLQNSHPPQMNASDSSSNPKFTETLQPQILGNHRRPYKQRRMRMGSGAENGKRPDASTASAIPPCSECGKCFPSWKALFGHMRCHPERQWRGIIPPPGCRRTGAEAPSCPSPSYMTSDDLEVAASLVLLSNSWVDGNARCDSGDGCQNISDGGGEYIVTGSHRCGVCLKVFSSGQALGGHMRCHWDQGNENGASSSSPITGCDLDLNSPAPLEYEDPSSLELALDLRLGI